MDDSRTQANEEGGLDMTEQYTGPSAMRIANLIPHRVSFDRGWFWTTTAICHGGKSDGRRFGSDRTATASTCAATPGDVLPAWS